MYDVPLFDYHLYPIFGLTLHHTNCPSHSIPEMAVMCFLVTVTLQLYKDDLWRAIDQPQDIAQEWSSIVVPYMSMSKSMIVASTVR